MTFTDWVQETRRRFHRDPLLTAVRGTAQELWVGGLARGLSYVHRGEPEPIWNREFDVCLVVDACRWDLFAEICAADEYDYLPDTPGKIRSVGSMSPEWISNTFGPKHADQCRRAGYVTANPFSGNENDSWPRLPLDESRVGYLDEAWRTHCINAGPDGISTTPPHVLTDKAIDVWRRRDTFDIDQLIIHYMQPHTPFYSRPEWFSTMDDDTKQAETQQSKDVYKRCRDGDLPEDEVWDAYRQNLHWVLDSIGLLIRSCDASVAITSDHGNGFGEWGVWGHPPGNPLSELRCVPWVKIDAMDTDEYEPAIHAADINSESNTDADVAEQLSALGYH